MIKRIGENNLSRILTKIKNLLGAYRTSAQQDDIDNEKQPKIIADEEEYYTVNTVEGALNEIGNRLEELPTETVQAEEIPVTTVRMDIYEDDVLSHTYYLIAEERTS